MCREVTDNHWLEYLPSLLGTETIPITRRGYTCDVTVGEIAKRAVMMARPRSDGGLSCGCSIAWADSDTLGRSVSAASSACSVDGIGGGGERGGELGARVIAEVEELKGVVASLWEGNDCDAMAGAR
jgi:hypothetical protein